MLSQVLIFATPWTAAWQASLSITSSQSLLKLISIEAVMPSNYLIPPQLLQSFQASGFFFFFFSPSESVFHISWSKYWSFSFRISTSNEYSRLISFSMDWLDLFAFQGTLKSLLQHHSSKASVIQRSAFFIVQLSHPYMTTGKTITLTRWTLVGRVMSWLFNMLSRLVIAFLPRSKCLLVSWLQSPSAVILDPPPTHTHTNKITHCFHYFPSVCHDMMRPDAMILVFWMLSFKPVFSLSSFTFIKILFSSSLLSAISVVSSAYLMLFLLAILILACDSSSLAFYMIYSAYKLNNQSDNIQPCHSSFLILSLSVVPYLVLFFFYIFKYQLYFFLIDTEHSLL